jgi:hypothetical protein
MMNQMILIAYLPSSKRKNALIKEKNLVNNEHSMSLVQ